MIRYDPHVWRQTFFAIRGSMLRVIALRSFFVGLGALGLTIVHFYVFPFTFPNVSKMHDMVGTSLGLLLVFRTNQAYDRWWEGRKLWGALVNTTRNLARAASVHLAHDPARLRTVLALAQAFPAATMAVLRQKPWVPSGLPESEAWAIAAKPHAPTAIAQRISWHLEQERKAGRLTDMVFTSLDANQHALVDIVGACERIHKTPLPFAYVVHLRRALVLYCASLPFAIASIYGWANIFVVYFISYILLGIEEIGVEIEDPFEGDDNDLPLEEITAGIQAGVGAWMPDASVTETRT